MFLIKVLPYLIAAPRGLPKATVSKINGLTGSCAPIECVVTDPSLFLTTSLLCLYFSLEASLIIS